MFTNLVNGLTQLMTLAVFPYLLIGMCIGMCVAILPGLGVGVALSLMLTLLYHMKVDQGVVLMLGTLAGEYFSASITAILLNTPGAPESYPTTHDGFPMAQRGEAGRALAISATCTWLGGWIGCIVFVLLLQLAGSLIALFKPPEYMAFIILALVVVGQAGNIVASKVIVSGGFGFMLSFIGSDPVSGANRFTGGMPALISGIDVVPFALGVFAVTQMVVMYGTGLAVSGAQGKVAIKDFGSQIRIGVKDTFRHPFDVARSAVLASLLGLIPGIGGFTANYISYGVGQKVSKARKDFGTGVPEGIICAEASSLAKEAGSLLPAVALGLPSGVGMVLFIAALSILGVQPGVALFTSRPALPYTMMWTMAIVVLLSCVIGLALAPRISAITRIRGPFLLPFICGLAALGSYSAVVNSAGMLEMLFFVVVGVLARKCRFSVASMAVGLVLGATFDDNVFNTAQSYGWSFLWKSPIADAALAIAVVIVVGRVVGSRRRARLAKQLRPTEGDERTRRLEGAWQLEMLVDAVFAVGGLLYLLVALGYPRSAGVIPAATAGVVAAVSIIRLIGDVLRWLGSREFSKAEVGGAEGPNLAMPEVLTSPQEEDITEQRSSGSSGGVKLGLALQTEEALTAPFPVSIVQGGGSLGGIVCEGVNRREVVAVLWAAGFVIGILAFGFQLGVPLAALLYCLVGVRIVSKVRKVLYTVSTVAVLYGLVTLFLTAFHLTFSGVLL